MDPTTGLALLGARLYDTSQGRFTSTDPIPYPTNLPYLNAYQYAANQPLIYFDPTGRFLQELANAAAGFGDAVTFGGTNAIREAIGVNNVVDHNSRTYKAGAITGVVAVIVATGGAAVEALAARGISPLGATTLYGAIEGGGYAAIPGFDRYQPPNPWTLTAGIGLGAAGGATAYFLGKGVSVTCSKLATRGTAAAGAEAETAAESAASLNLSIGEKIAGQMGPRGWSESLMQETVDNPAATHNVWDFTTGTRQAATAYARPDGSYVVVNDETGAVVQVSDINKVGWKPVWDDPSFKR